LLLTRPTATKRLPPRLLGRYLSLIGAAEAQFNHGFRSECHTLLSTRLHIARDSPAYNVYALQLCRNVMKWSLPPTHSYWRASHQPHTLSGAEHIRACLREGRGLILLMSHFGPWPYLQHELARHGFPIDLTYPLGWPFEAQNDQAARIRFLLRARRALAQNNIVALMNDVGLTGVSGLGRTVDLSFLDGTSPFPFGGAFLSVQTGAPLVPIFSLEHDDGRHEIICNPPIVPTDYLGDRNERARHMLKCYAECLAEQVRAHPGNATSYIWGLDCKCSLASPTAP
jgi:lauroyl/myristoyl acyltransferase